MLSCYKLTCQHFNLYQVITLISVLNWITQRIIHYTTQQHIAHNIPPRTTTRSYTPHTFAQETGPTGHSAQYTTNIQAQHYTSIYYYAIYIIQYSYYSSIHYLSIILLYYTQFNIPNSAAFTQYIYIIQLYIIYTIIILIALYFTTLYNYIIIHYTDISSIIQYYEYILYIYTLLSSSPYNILQYTIDLSITQVQKIIVVLLIILLLPYYVLYLIYYLINIFILVKYIILVYNTFSCYI